MRVQLFYVYTQIQIDISASHFYLLVLSCRMSYPRYLFLKIKHGNSTAAAFLLLLISINNIFHLPLGREKTFEFQTPKKIHWIVSYFMKLQGQFNPNVFVFKITTTKKKLNKKVKQNYTRKSALQIITWAFSSSKSQTV